MADIMSNITLAVIYRAVNPETGCRGGAEIPTLLTLNAGIPSTTILAQFQHAPGCKCLCGPEVDVSSPKLRYIHDHVEKICDKPDHELDVEVFAVMFLKLALCLPVPEMFQLKEIK